MTTMVVRERKAPRDDARHARRATSPARASRSTPGVPAVLPAKPQAANRLDLAKWLVDPTNPLTARVAVNRLWGQFFGTRHRRDRERLRHAGHAADASGAARLAGDASSSPAAGRSRRCTG